MMISLQDSDPVIRNYMIKHSLPQIYKALLAGLCISCPEDPLLFIEEKILSILEDHDFEICWHTFIDKDKQISSLARGIVYDIFGNPEDSLCPSHLLEKAYSCYRTSLTKMCFTGWKGYISKKKLKAARLLERMEEAEMYHKQRRIKLAFIKWTAWVQFRKRRKNDAVRKLQKVQESVHCRNFITAWRHVVQDAKRTKEYFKKLERDLQESQISGRPQSDGQDRLSLLPNKLSLKIFQSLGVRELLKCAQLCRSWKAIAQISSLWTEIDFSLEASWITDQTVERILRVHRVYVISVNLCGCTLVQESSFRRISKLTLTSLKNSYIFDVIKNMIRTMLLFFFFKGQCRNLQELDLSECSHLNDENMKMILEGCRSLLHLNLAFTHITNATLRVLSRCCLTLRSLSLAYCTSFSDKGLQYLSTGKGCHRLTYLDLSGCSQISVDGFKYVAEACSTLQRIVLDDLPTLTDTCVQVLVAKCRMLTAISILDSPYLSDVAFKTFAEVISLTKVQIEGNNRMTDSGLKALCRSCLKLSEVQVSDCTRMTDASLKSLGSLTKLCNLNISGCIKVTDMGIHYITEGASAVELRDLDLSYCPKLTDLSLKRITQKCNKLTQLSVCFCENLTDNGFECLDICASLISLDITGCKIHDKGLAALGTNHSLRKLTASECVFITDNGIKMFCQNCKKLALLDVCQCERLSDRAIKALSFFCRTIATVRIAGCPKLTDTAVKYLTRVGHFLKELDVSGCPLLTDRTPSFLLCSCLQLRSISMLYCKNISKQAALKLQHRVQHWKHSNDDAPYSQD
ncbi:LOW QUALITY PROTEIN: dynein regulatory complex subunit 6 [Carassius gibelio]|uniref:LOW QUALITY PROTEIN: dynein regulatory complex subunit 6 n=1 Tax=Carassius gibelio TaxID=101364 RepID=UPI0022790D64|nr:LOW QUALITY PROTEIN: dynein regulatory complex subunit 6 [Carassius gibelio]